MTDFATEAVALLQSRRELKIQGATEDVAMLWVMEAIAYALLEVGKQISMLNGKE